MHKTKAYNVGCSVNDPRVFKRWTQLNDNAVLKDSPTFLLTLHHTPGPASVTSLEHSSHDSTIITTCVDGTAVTNKDTNERLCITFRHEFRSVKRIIKANMLEQ